MYENVQIDSPPPSSNFSAAIKSTGKDVSISVDLKSLLRKLRSPAVQTRSNETLSGDLASISVNLRSLLRQLRSTTVETLNFNLVRRLGIDSG